MGGVNDRINLMISELCIKKHDVADALGVSDSAVSLICSGKRNPSDQTVKMIAKCFGISEEWLLTGSGDMRIPMSKNERIVEFVNNIMGDENQSFKEDVIYQFSILSDEGWKALYNFLIEFKKTL